MAQATWAVKLIDKGRTLQVHVQAHTQAEARTSLNISTRATRP